jgi:hypothetical protein
VQTLALFLVGVQDDREVQLLDQVVSVGAIQVPTCDTRSETSGASAPVTA